MDLQQGDRILECYRLLEPSEPTGPVDRAPVTLDVFDLSDSTVSFSQASDVWLQELSHSHMDPMLAWIWPGPFHDPDLASRRAGLVHHNLAPLVAIGEEGPYCVAIEKEPEGVSALEHLMAYGPLPEGEAEAVLSQVAEALIATYSAGFWHGHLVADRVRLLREEGAWRVLVHGSGYLPPVGTPGDLSNEDYDLSAFCSLAVLVSCGIEVWDRWRATGGVSVPEVMPAGLRAICTALLEIDRGASGWVRFASGDDAHPRASIRSVADLGRALERLSYPEAGSEHVDANAEVRTEGDYEIVRHGELREAIIDEIRYGQRDNLGPFVGFVLQTRDGSGDWTQSKSVFWARREADLYRSVRWAWPGAEISFYDPERRTHTDGSRSYLGWQQTVAVLEPYWPVSVTRVHTAIGCPSRVLVDLRRQNGPNIYLVLGNLVHAMLEGLAHDTDATFEELFDEVLPKMRLAIAAAGLGDDNVYSLRDNARTHFANLKRFRQTDGSPAVGVRTEMSRYSGAYGIEGRIDLALDGDNGFHIVELKTGRAREEHIEQVRCYGLLWHGLAEARGHRMTGRLVYSKDGSVLTVDVDDVTHQRRILRYRNDLLAMHRALADPAFVLNEELARLRAERLADSGNPLPANRDGHREVVPYFEMPGHTRECRSYRCHYRRASCSVQGELFGERPDLTSEGASRAGVWSGIPAPLVQRAWSYYRHMVTLLETEYWITNAHMGRILRKDALPERIAEHAAVQGLRLAEASPSTHHVILTGEHGRVLHDGDEVIAHRGDLVRDEIMCGRIVELRPGRVVLSTQAAEAATRFPADGWVIDRMPFRRGHRAAHRALTGFMLSRDTARLETLLGPAPEQPPSIDFDDLPTIASDELNLSQRRAVSFALSDPSAALIQGPPGTGKTFVIAEIVRRLVARGERVLIAAQTNTAVDNVVRTLVSGTATQPPLTELFRLGRADNAPESVLSAIHAAGALPERIFLDTYARHEGSVDALKARCLEVPVVATTTHRATRHDLFHLLGKEKSGGDRRKEPLGVYGPTFDVVIIDEAGQLTEPMALAAINHGKRFILVGDHKQLPPIVPSEVSARTRPERRLHGTPVEDLNLGGLDKSLFERLLGRVPHILLDAQYRMHSSIMALSNRLFYDKQLDADPTCADRVLDLAPEHLEAMRPDLVPILRPDAPLVYIDCAGEDSGRYNVAESDCIVDLVSALTDGEHALDPGRIGVISPYRAQVHKIRDDVSDRLGTDFLARIDIDTVDRFQGGERDVIFVSLVKTEEVSEFLTDLRRLNVTLTRARTKLVIVGLAATLCEHPLYRDLLLQPEIEWFRWDIASRRAQHLAGPTVEHSLEPPMTAMGS